MKKNLPLIIILIVVIAAGSFYGGMVYGKSQNPSRPAGFNGQFPSNRNRQGLGQNGDTIINGQILSKDDKSITVKLRDNGSKIIFYSDQTTIGKFTSGNVNDLAVNLNVMINGKTNADGSVSANSIQIRPELPNPVASPSPANTPAATK